MIMYPDFISLIISRLALLLFFSLSLIGCDFVPSTHFDLVEVIPLPGTSDVYFRLFCAKNDSTWFCGVPQRKENGISLSFYQTDDGGAVWYEKSRLDVGRLPSTRFFGFRNNKLYYCVSGGYSMQSSSLFMSQDDGCSWKQILHVNEDIQTVHVWDKGIAVVTAPFSGSFHLLTTLDGGLSWQQHAFPAEVTGNHYSFREDDILYLSIKGGMYRRKVLSDDKPTLFFSPPKSVLPKKNHFKENWFFCTSYDYLVLSAKSCTKCFAFVENQLEARSCISRRITHGAKQPCALFNRGDTVVVSLRNDESLDLSQTVVSYDGGRSWTSLSQDTYHYASESFVYSVSRDGDSFVVKKHWVTQNKER